MIIIFSVSAIHAADVNVTDVSGEDSSLQLSENDSLSSVDSLDSSKNQTQLTSPTRNVYYRGSYSVTLTDSNASIADRQISFVIDNKNYAAKTDSNGVASVKLKLSPGKYIANAFFAGDNLYQSCNLTSSFKILPTVKAANITKYYNGDTKYTATFFTSQGKALSKVFVNVTVNGKIYTKKTNNKGVVSLNVNLKPGTYKITAKDPITGYALTTNFKILSTINAENLNKVAGDGKKFTAKFLKANGKALANKYVKFKIKGKIHKVRTNSKGEARLSLDGLDAGTYKVVCYNNDALSRAYTVKIFKIATTKMTVKSYTFFPNDKKEIRIKFSTSLGDDSNSGKIIKIKIGDKTYSKKTDADGIINFKLPSINKGIYNVQYKYAGNKFFKSSSSNRVITVYNDTSKTRLKIVGTSSFGYGAGTLLKVAYSADSVPLVNRDVTFHIDGKTFIEMTDNKGIASIPIDLKIGSYTVNLKTDDEARINGTSAVFQIKVFKRADSKISWQCGDSFKDSSQTFKVLATDTKGNPVSDGIVELTIDGESYAAAVNSKGFAKFKTSVAIGKYKVSFRFLGNNELLESSSSKKINVKLSKFGRGLNEKNAVSYLRAYLKSSSHCKVGSPAIKTLVKSLTKGLTNDVDKAKAIFNYVRDTLEYSLYYNTHYGATGTLKVKKGNCVDHSHLLVAMFRTAGFKARYVHGVCHFIQSDHTYGHVWTQVAIGKTWVCADATSYRNALGKVVNWDTSSYKIHAKYASLPF